MPSTNRQRLVAALILASFAMPLVAAPSDPAGVRIQGFRQLGAAFKALNDGLRRPSPQLAAIQASARQIRNAANHQYGWFPAGSGPRPGVKTAAKPEIWAQGQRFRQAQAAFATQAAALERAVAGGNVPAIRSAARTLGATCKGCHDQFRTET
jgi:cytochrome c556